MKYCKLFLILIVCLLLVGCGNEGYQVSELKPVYGDLPYTLNVKGILKNISNENCKTVLIRYTYTNGTIKDDEEFTVDSPNVGEYINFNETSFIERLDEWGDFKLKIKEIICYWEKD